MSQVNKQEIQNKLAGLIKQYIPSLQNEEITSETAINSKGYESLNYIYIICTLENVDETAHGRRGRGRRIQCGYEVIFVAT